MSTTTGPGIERTEALEFLKNHLANDRLVAHCVATEAIMRTLAPRFDADPDVWGVAGLLHDLDFEETGEDESRHAEVAAERLAARGVSPEVINAIRKHNAEGLGLKRETEFEHALTCAETITGLVVATALVYPDKKLASVKPKSIAKRMKTAHFARAVSRERIRECETIGIPLAEFVALSLAAMQEIAGELGL